MFLRSVGNAIVMFLLRCSDDYLSMLWSCSGDLLTMFWRWTHWVRACRPFLFLQIFRSSLLPFFFSSFLPNLLTHRGGGNYLPAYLPWRTNKGVESVLKCVVTMCFSLICSCGVEGREGDKNHQDLSERTSQKVSLLVLWSPVGPGYF